MNPEDIIKKLRSGNLEESLKAYELLKKYTEFITESRNPLSAKIESQLRLKKIAEELEEEVESKPTVIKGGIAVPVIPPKLSIEIPTIERIYKLKLMKEIIEKRPELLEEYVRSKEFVINPELPAMFVVVSSPTRRTTYGKHGNVTQVDIYCGMTNPPVASIILTPCDGNLCIDVTGKVIRTGSNEFEVACDGNIAKIIILNQHNTVQINTSQDFESRLIGKRVVINLKPEKKVSIPTVTPTTEKIPEEAEYGGFIIYYRTKIGNNIVNRSQKCEAYKCSIIYRNKTVIMIQVTNMPISDKKPVLTIGSKYIYVKTDYDINVQDNRLCTILKDGNVIAEIVPVFKRSKYYCGVSVYPICDVTCDKPNVYVKLKRLKG